MRFNIITAMVVVGMLLASCSGLAGDASHQAGTAGGHVESMSPSASPTVPAANEVIPTGVLTQTSTVSQQTVVLEDLGMFCTMCRAAVTARLDRVPGIITATVDLPTDSATVRYDPSQVTVEELKQAIAEVGYQVRGVREVEND